MNSMTGFGRGIAADEALQITVEIKTVNSRFLDLHINMPSTLIFLKMSCAVRLKVYCNAVKWKSIFRYAIHGIGKKILP